MRQNDTSLSVSSTFNLRSRATSPTPSTHSTQSQQVQPGGPRSKRSLFEKVTGRHKNDKLSPGNLPTSESTASLQTQSSTPVKGHTDRGKSISKPIGKAKTDLGTLNMPPRKESRLPFKTKKDTVSDVRPVKDPNQHADEASALWHLDTDMSHMEGIVDHNQPPMTPPTGEIYTGWPAEQPAAKEPQPEDTAAWDAPDSWAVKRVTDENIDRLRELDDEGQRCQR